MWVIYFRNKIVYSYSIDLRDQIVAATSRWALIANIVIHYFVHSINILEEANYYR